ncbi:hypothetical protein ANO11243_017840 [Dothideomycetidae sp. 11243]|nr:hypothetical protein ANO11243_017840 [fungal sp. No.11243]
MAAARATASKDRAPLTGSFLPVFIRNQFRTKIPLPTKDKFPSVKGKTAIVTGSNTGLGFESARQLLVLGLSHLIMAVRSLERGNAAAQKLHAANPAAKIQVWQLDMESYPSIKQFVAKCETDIADAVDIVILNAGLSPIRFDIVPATGHEKTIQVNHLSTAMLATLIIPVLISKSRGSAHPPHLTIVNSVTAHLVKFPNRNIKPLLPSFDDPKITPWDPQERYGISKFLSQVFLVRLADHISSDKVVINMVDPGLTKDTGLARDTSGLLRIAVKLFFSVAGRPIDIGAATYVDAVLGHGRESHGCFLMNCDIAP